MNVRPRGVRDVLGNRDGYADQAGTKKQQSGPLVLSRRGAAKPGERQDEREHLPSDGVRQECERMDIGPVDRWKSGHAPRARIDPRAPQRPDERQWAVDSTMPQHASVEELFRTPPHEPALPPAVPPPVGALPPPPSPPRCGEWGPAGARWWSQRSADEEKPIFQPRACSRQQMSTSSPARRNVGLKPPLARNAPTPK